MCLVSRVAQLAFHSASLFPFVDVVCLASRGLGAANVDDCRRALVEKADMVKVEARIERKYQDIVVYLNQAIKVAGDDEVRGTHVTRS